MRLSYLLLVILLMVGCAPRGETKSLEEILTNSRYAFKSADQQGLDSTVATHVNNVSKSIEASITQADAGQDSGPNLTEVSQALDFLITKAGITSRPAMSELATQYRELGALSAKNNATSAQVKLLAARTYTLISSELGTTRFSL